MDNVLAQATWRNEQGKLFLQDDWYPNPLPDNIELEEMAYPDTSYSFTNFFSEKPVGFSLGFASGNYGHSSFTTGINGEIKVGKFVVLQGTRIVCNASVTIMDHCMVSWGSVITDSWFTNTIPTAEERRAMLKNAAHVNNRHLDFNEPKPVLIEENAWIGFSAIIMPGVTVGRGAVVGSKTIITEDVPPYAVVVGHPARIIKYLDRNDTAALKQRAIHEYLHKPNEA